MKVGEKEVEKPLASYDEADFKVVQKNFKALKFVMSGLGPSDKKKVLSSKIAKKKWDALEKIHQGTENVKRDIIVSRMQDYHNLCMKDKEEIEEFQARFLALINSLERLGEDIPNWKQVTKVLHCLNKTQDPIAIHFQTQPTTKDLDIDEFFGRLSVFSGA